MTDLLSLDFANAHVSSAADLRRWLEAEASVDAARSEEISLRLPEFLRLQAAVREAVAGTLDGEVPASAVERLNEVSARVPRILRLGAEGRQESPLGGSTTALALARIAWSAIELIAGPERERLRRCPACGRFFLATRADRVWCSAACGNRTRVARFHASRRGRS